MEYGDFSDQLSTYFNEGLDTSTAVNIHSDTRKAFTKYHGL